MRKAISVFIFFIISAAACAQEIDGKWHGILSTPLEDVYVVIDIEYREDGLTGTMDMPTKGISAMPLTSLDYDAPDMSFAINSLRIRYSGEMSGEGVIEGEFSQGSVFELNFTRVERSQAVEPPFAYRSMDVRFSNEAAEAVLAGTLTLPAEGNGPYPAVVLVSGSGLQNRDEEIMGHKPFLVLADHLTRNGIAVLRYDDRGFGESTGDPRAATTTDFAQDALCGFEFLRSHTEIDSGRIGVIGHSEGGTIAMMLAADNPDIAFIVSLAGVAVKGDRLLVEQNRNIFLAQGIDEPEVEVYCRTLARIFDLQQQVAFEQIKEGIKEYRSEILNEEVKDILPSWMSTNLNVILGSPVSGWLLHFLELDPAGYIERIECPVLALNGAKDLQINASTNLGRIEKILAESGSYNFIVREYDSLNHLFQHTETGKVAEYGMIAETMSPEVLGDISGWILSL